MFKRWQAWKRRQQEIMDADIARKWCAGHGHIPMFSQQSELYWFGMKCCCVRCGVELHCPEKPGDPARAV